MTKKMLLLATALVFASGCAAMRAASARQASLQSSLDNLSMQSPPDQVLSAARMILVQRGFAPKDVGQGIIETDWKYASSNGAASSSAQSWKYVVTAVQMGEGTHLVVMKNMQQEQYNDSGSSSTPKSTRDLELELEIVRQLDPATAAKIQSDADRSAEAARNS